MYLNTCCGKYVAWRILPVCYGGGVREKIYCFLHRVFPINIYIYIYIYAKTRLKLETMDQHLFLQCMPMCYRVNFSLKFFACDDPKFLT